MASARSRTTGTLEPQPCTHVRGRCGMSAEWPGAGQTDSSRANMLASTRKVSSAASDELRQYRRARRSNATDRHDSSPGPDLADRGGPSMSLCFEISLNSAPPVVAGGKSLAVVTAMAVMRGDGGVPEVEM